MLYHINGIIVLDVFLIVYSQKAECNLANCYLAESDLADNKLAAAVRFWTECYMAESFFCAWISVVFFCLTRSQAGLTETQHCSSSLFIHS